MIPLEHFTDEDEDKYDEDDNDDEDDEDESYLVMIVIIVKRSGDLWRFACGNVFGLKFCWKISENFKRIFWLKIYTKVWVGKSLKCI